MFGGGVLQALAFVAVSGLSFPGLELSDSVWAGLLLLLFLLVRLLLARCLLGLLGFGG